MARTHALHRTDCDSLLRRFTIAALLVAVACTMSACGGGADPAISGANPVITGGATADLEWEASTTPDVAGYRIYYGTAPGSYSQILGNGVNAGNVTSFRVTGLNSGQTYYFAASAYDLSNNESGFSNEVSKAIP